MRINDFATVTESVDFDDSLLVGKLFTLEQEIQTKGQTLEQMLKNDHNDEDYLLVTLARFAYAFAKEEYSILSSEAEKRGLIV